MDEKYKYLTLEKSGGETPSLRPIFCNFLEKKAILMPLNHIS